MLRPVFRIVPLLAFMALPGCTSTALLQSVNKVNSTVALASLVNPSAYGSLLTLTATITPSSATGMVTFTDGSAVLRTSTISNGAAVFTTSTLAGGSHSITASYAGDTNDSPSTSPTLAQTVSKANSTSVLSSAPNPSTYGSAVTLTATVMPGTATGTVTFTDGSTALGTSTISSGAAVLSTSTLGGGSHSITASYSGDANDAGSSTLPLKQTVTALNSTVALASVPNPSTYGSLVTFTTTVLPLTTSGTVTFMDGSATLGTGSISNGTAVFNTSTLGGGSHSITASYGGDMNDTGATTPALSQIVNAVPQIVTTSLPTAIPGLSYFATLAANSGTPPYTWSIGSGGLPPGLSLQAGTGAISGIPTAGIEGNFVVQATDANSVTATQPLSIATLMSLAIAPADSSLAAGSGQQLIASGTLSDNSVQDLTSSVTWSSSDNSVATVGSGLGSQGFAMAVASGTATITAALGSTQITTVVNVQPATAPGLTYSARTDNCVDGTQTGCASGKLTGEAGASLIFREKVSDTIPAGFTGTVISSGSCPSGSTPSAYPAYCPAPMNSTATDPDFGAYLVMGTDDSTYSPNSAMAYKAAWNMRSDGEWDAFSWDETLLLTENSFGAGTILNINPAAIHAQTCATAPGCVSASGIFSAPSGSGDSTHLASGGNWSFSRVPGETHVLYERAGIATQVNQLVISSSIATPGTGNLSRSLYVDFTSDSPVPCSVMESAAPGNPTSYSASWAGSFQVADDGSISYAMTGGYDWAPSWTVTPIDTFTLPTVGNAGKFGFQATSITGTGMTGTTPPIWCQTAGCSVVDASSSGSVTWTNVDKLSGQGPGFDVVIYRPPNTASAGCTRLNTRLGKIYRGTGNAAPAGYMSTNDQVACTRAGTYPSACVMPDRFTLHEAAQILNGQFVEFSPTGGEMPNPPKNWNSGTLSCQASNTSWQGSYSSANAYDTHNIVSYSGLYYTALKSVPAGNGHAPSGTTISNAYWSNTESYCSSYIFDTTSTLVAPVTDWVWGAGHAASGYLHKYQGDLYRSMLYGVTCPDCPAINGRLNPGTPMLLAPLPCDGHGTYRNSGIDDLTPMFAVTTDVPAWTTRYVAACYDELCAFDPGGSGLTYRFGHTYNTGSSSYFQIRNNIGVNSPLGDLIAFGSDMMGTRGSNVSANTACNNLRGQYRPSADGVVTYQDFAFPTTNNANSNVLQATGCGADTPGATCTEGSTQPNWDSACTTNCTDGSVTWTNVGPNTCRGDIVIMDANRAHSAP